MERSAFENMLELAILEAADSILKPGSRKVNKPSAMTLRLLSQHPISIRQRKSAIALYSASASSYGCAMTLKTSADLPPCF